MKTFFFMIFFFFPAYMANLFPIIFAKIIPKWDTPADFGRKYRNKRILGKNKTIRGFVTGTFCGLLTGILQYYLVTNNIISLKLTIYHSLNRTLILSFLLGFGALFGDAVKSFFKRQININEGKPWLPFDWMDHAVGSILLSFWYFNPGLQIYFLGLIIGPFLSFIMNLLGRLFRLKKTWL
jgi:CDP-2,3-bis-(O-geranylgeranyl)-sn-glycerol synthase